MRRSDMEVIDFQAKINKLTRKKDYNLHKAREITNKAEKLARQGAAAASFYSLKAKDFFTEADTVAKTIAEMQHAFNNPDFWTRVRRFFNIGRTHGSRY